MLSDLAGALRRFLLERDCLPDKPLTAGIPVSVRPQDDEGTGNAISFIVATLATDIAGHLLANHPLAKVAITIEKHILPNTECVAVHIERARPGGGFNLPTQTE